MIERRCRACKYDKVLLWNPPCSGCYGIDPHPNWQPKEPEQPAEPELKHCAHCGNNTAIFTTNLMGYSAGCWNLFCSVRTGYFPTKAEAAAAWNKRFAPVINYNVLNPCITATPDNPVIFYSGELSANVTYTVYTTKDENGVNLNSLMAENSRLREAADVWQEDYILLQAENDRLRAAMKMARKVLKAIETEGVSVSDVRAARRILNDALKEEPKTE